MRESGSCVRRHTISLGVLVYALIMGLAMPIHAQECNPAESAKLLAQDGAEGDYLSLSVSISGNTAFVGAQYHDGNGLLHSGSAYVFENVAGAWTQVAKLTADDGAENHNFGCSVCVSDDTAIVGALGTDDFGAYSGSAYVFENVAGAWIQTAKLNASDAAAYDQFGSSVSISGDTAVIAAQWDGDNGLNSGSVYVFENVAGVWTQTAKLTADDGAAQDEFGSSVSISGNTACIGAVYDDDLGNESGSAYVFENVGGTWTQTAKLTADDGSLADLLGISISVNGNTAVVGAPGDDDDGFGSGSAYVFEKNAGAWTQAAKITADDGSTADYFGISVSINGTTVVVGASGDDDNGADASGSAYILKNIGGVWTQDAKITASDGAVNDHFGNTVCVNGDTALVGAPDTDDNGLDSGSAYVFDLNCNCPPDFNGDTVVNSLDFIAFLNDFTTGNPSADHNNDGSVDSQDFIAFLNDFVAGC